MHKLLSEEAPHLLREWMSEKNSEISPDDLRVNSGIKVWWQCQKDARHQWKTSVSHRALGGTGCPYCSGNKVLREESFAAKCPDVAKELHPTKNGDFDPFNVSPHSNKRVWWQCQHKPPHEWQAVIKSRAIDKSGCRKCNALKNTVASHRPDLAEEWHPTLNDLPAAEVPAYANKIIWWQCKANPEHVWKTKLETRYHGSAGRCPQCGKRKPQKKLSLAEFDPVLAAQWHPVKNGDVTAKDVTQTTSSKAWWICPVNPEHEWEASVRNRAVLGSGCPYCAKVSRRPAPGQSIADLFPKLAREWHPTKNGELTPEDVSRGSAKRVWWLCQDDPSHVWDATVVSRANPRSKQLCPFCSGHRVTEKNSLAANYPKIAEEWHKERNGDLTPNDVSKASGKKAWWQCSQNPEHFWEAKIKNRTLLGSGCPLCNTLRLQEGVRESAQSGGDSLKTFKESMKAVHKLSEQKFPEHRRLAQPMYRMLHVFTITALETYLSDTFQQQVLRDKHLTTILLTTDPELKKRSYSIHEVIDWYENAQKKATDHLYDIVWHNLGKIRCMYRTVLGVEFPADMDSIFRAVIVRHDLVHRNGKTKDGVLHRLKQTDLTALFSSVEKFVSTIDEQIKSKV